MKKIGLVVLMGCLFLVVVMSIYADDVYTKEGKKFVGSIIEETDESLTVETENGIVLVNKTDLMHVEKSETEESTEPAKNIIDTIKKVYHKVSRNKWFYVRRRVKRFHTKLFLELNKNRIYQLVTGLKGVERFRDENYKSFVFAVYMVLLLIVGMILTFIQKMFYKAYCKIKGIKPRYDT